LDSNNREPTKSSVPVDPWCDLHEAPRSGHFHYRCFKAFNKKTGDCIFQTPNTGKHFATARFFALVPSGGSPTRKSWRPPGRTRASPSRQATPLARFAGLRLVTRHSGYNRRPRFPKIRPGCRRWPGLSANSFPHKPAETAFLKTPPGAAQPPPPPWIRYIH